MKSHRISAGWLAGSLMAVGVLLLSGCSAPLASYTRLYEEQSAAIQGVPPDAATAAALAGRFATTFDHMGTDAFLPAVDKLFAPGPLYFNDTLAVYRDYAPLRRHMADMNEHVLSAQVSVVDHWVAGDSVFVRWHMTYSLSLLGQQRDLASYGISQLKINADARVIFQQDYWDGSNGFYRQLPVVGWLYRRILPIEGL